MFRNNNYNKIFFLREDYNLNLINICFHLDHLVPPSYRTCIRFEKSIIFRRVNGAVYFFVFCKEQVPEVLNNIT
jgi:hypothetical protein